MQYYWMWAIMGTSYKVYGDRPDWNRETLTLFCTLSARNHRTRTALQWWG